MTDNSVMKRALIMQSFAPLFLILLETVINSV